MIPSILCYVPPSAEFLGSTTTPVFKSGSTTLQIFKPDWRPCVWRWTVV